jgi:hypothetical protein
MCDISERGHNPFLSTHGHYIRYDIYVYEIKFWLLPWLSYAKTIVTQNVLRRGIKQNTFTLSESVACL